MRIIVLSGAGISAESGLKTFRACDGLWENFPVEEVATPAGWQANRQKVLDFYNARRKQVLAAHPNPAHVALAQLETKHSVSIITQNIDDLHERAGSSRVLHLHGEILKGQSSIDPDLTIPWRGEMAIGDKCPRGSQLRPNVVWFGEAVPLLSVAAEIVVTAEILIVVGTSLAVYPAAGLIEYATKECRSYLVDPSPPPLPSYFRPTILKGSASLQLPELVRILTP